MTALPTVLVAEPDGELRAAIAEMAARDCRARVVAVEGLAAIAPHEAAPDLAIARWSDNGGGGLLRRSARADGGPAPYLLILTDSITPARIAIASKAGRTELIPSNHLDLRALGNRIVLLLWGAEALRRRCDSDDHSGQARLAGFPALKRRVAA